MFDLFLNAHLETLLLYPESTKVFSWKPLKFLDLFFRAFENICFDNTFCTRETYNPKNNP